MDNPKRKEAYHKSRIGQILIQKGYITEQQLDQALTDEVRDDLRLGERLMDRQLISRWQLRRALSSQTRLRFAAFLSVVMMDFLRGDLKEGVEGPVNPEFLHYLAENESLRKVDYKPTESRLDIHTDGSVCLKIMCNRGELQFDHIRLLMSPGLGYESLSLDDLDLSKLTMIRRSVYKKGQEQSPLATS